MPVCLQSGGVNRELSFAPPSAALPNDSQQLGGDSRVEHVESLGSWLKQGQGEGGGATRRPSVKLSGQSPFLSVQLAIPCQVCTIIAYTGISLTSITLAMELTI